jgi:fatty-acyl-CoA synthase
MAEQARQKARQGVAYELQEEVVVLDPDSQQRVPWDGETQGEIVFRGNIVMKGYLKQPDATVDAFRGGWFWSGDLAVQHPDGYIEIKDRSKDIIILGRREYFFDRGRECSLLPFSGRVCRGRGDAR